MTKKKNNITIFLKKKIRKIKREQREGIKDESWYYVWAMQTVLEFCEMCIAEVEEK